LLVGGLDVYLMDEPNLATALGLYQNLGAYRVFFALGVKPKWLGVIPKPDGYQLWHLSYLSI